MGFLPHPPAILGGRGRLNCQGGSSAQAVFRGSGARYDDDRIRNDAEQIRLSCCLCVCKEVTQQ